MIDYKKHGNIHLLTMSDGPNMICADWHSRMFEILDIIEADCGKGAAMVLTGQDKFFCNGLNLEKLGSMDRAGWTAFAANMSEIHRRMIILPCPTVAAVNGHAFAGGAFVALSCDYRIMREDKGWICISEVDVGVPFGESMMGILRHKLPAATARDAILTGRRYTGPEAVAAGFADATASEEKLLEDALGLAAKLATKEPGIFKTLKQNYFAPIADGLASA
ncbi:MAG: enoyl-CoA hydratase/isomerase family protein [Halioglobus sp.]